MEYYKFDPNNFDYNRFKFDALAAITNIGRVANNPPVTRLSFSQRKKFSAKNIMTDDKWQVRLIGDKLVEISYTWMCRAPMIGVTVFHLFGLDNERFEMDCKASEAVFEIADLVAKLESLKATCDPTSKYHEKT